MYYTSYAKLNLNLSVFPIEHNGYHPIKSHFQEISLADNIHIVPGPKCQWELFCSNSTISSSENILTRIYQDLKEELSVGFTVHLEKTIPTGSGMGGGSSNAAAFLRMLNTYYLHWDDETLKKNARHYGSDIPFFLTGGSACVEGQGERITPIPRAKYSHYVTITPPIHCDTTLVYTTFDKLEQHHSPQLTVGQNDLLPAVLSTYPKLNNIINICQQYVKKTPCLSGSGSTFFLPYSDQSIAKKDYHLLRTHIPNSHIHLCTPV